jgi:hypothetical protein
MTREPDHIAHSQHLSSPVGTLTDDQGPRQSNRCVNSAVRYNSVPAQVSLGGTGFAVCSGGGTGHYDNLTTSSVKVGKSPLSTDRHFAALTGERA